MDFFIRLLLRVEKNISGKMDKISKTIILQPFGQPYNDNAFFNINLSYHVIKRRNEKFSLAATDIHIVTPRRQDVCYLSQFQARFRKDLKPYYICPVVLTFGEVFRSRKYIVPDQNSSRLHGIHTLKIEVKRPLSDTGNFGFERMYVFAVFTYKGIFQCFKRFCRFTI